VITAEEQLMFSSIFSSGAAEVSLDDLKYMFAPKIDAIKSALRARRVGDTVRVRDLRWHLQVLWAHVGELLTMVMEECAAWAAGGDV
jgi:hypothetical protein